MGLEPIFSSKYCSLGRFYLPNGNEIADSADEYVYIFRLGENRVSYRRQKVRI